MRRTRALFLSLGICVVLVLGSGQTTRNTGCAQPIPPSVWSRTYGGASGDIAQSAEQTSDGGYIVAGTTGSSGAGLTDMYLVKTNADGHGLWFRTFGGLNWDSASSVAQTSQQQ